MSVTFPVQAQSLARHASAARFLSAHEVVGALALLTSAALLAGAHLFERVGHLAPCLLCLEQREVHWLALASALALLALGRVRRLRGIGVPAALFCLGALYLWSAALAGFHAGVEWRFWPGPLACASGSSVTDAPAAADILLALDAVTAAAPSCEVAAWRAFGISMAGYNALISAVLALFCANAATRAVLHGDAE